MSALSPSEARDYANLGEQAHIPILHCALAPLIGDGAGHSLLDFGCGDGRLTCRLAALGFDRILALDENEKLLTEAREEASRQPAELASRLTFRRGDESALPTEDRFDVALCSLMLMMCDERRRLDAAVRGMVHSLTPQGRAFIVLTHPCFRNEVHARFHNRLPEGFRYWNSGTPYEVVLDPEERQVEATFYDYHWTLTDYAQSLTRAGALIDHISEIPGQYDKKGHPVGNPAYLLLTAIRK